jgi:hypothetical protein
MPDATRWYWEPLRPGIHGADVPLTVFGIMGAAVASALSSLLKVYDERELNSVWLIRTSNTNAGRPSSGPGRKQSRGMWYLRLKFTPRAR